MPEYRTMIGAYTARLAVLGQPSVDSPKKRAASGGALPGPGSSARQTLRTPGTGPAGDPEEPLPLPQGGTGMREQVAVDGERQQGITLIEVEGLHLNMSVGRHLPVKGRVVTPNPRRVPRVDGIRMACSRVQEHLRRSASISAASDVMTAGPRIEAIGTYPNAGACLP